MSRERRLCRRARPARGGATAERGQSIVEFGLLVSTLLLFLLGAIDFGRLMYTQMAVTNASRVGAEYILNVQRCTNANANYPADVKSRIQAESMPGVTITNIVVPSVASCAEGNDFTITVQASFTFATPMMANLLGGSNPRTVTGSTTGRFFQP